ncbi:unnamed protein product [Prunus armeniaca]
MNSTPPCHGNCWKWNLLFARADTIPVNSVSPSPPLPWQDSNCWKCSKVEVVAKRLRGGGGGGRG